MSGNNRNHRPTRKRHTNATLCSHFTKRTRMNRYPALGALAATVLLLTSCTAEAGTEPTKTVTVTATAAAEPQQPNEEPTEKEDDVDVAASQAPASAMLSDMTGKTLQVAQDSAQAEGFWILAEEDATGQSRIPLWDRGWTVCSQDPAAGEHDTETTVTFHVVKDTEVCP